MAGQVLEISRHETAAAAIRMRQVGKMARVYRFPSRTPVVLTEAPAPEPARVPKSNFYAHLGIELTIGMVLWLTWFVWHLLH